MSICNKFSGLGLFFCLCIIAVTVQSATFYVDALQADDIGAGTSWATAKKTIQAAVDLTADGDMVMVTNGLYSIGGGVAPGSSLMNRVCITNDITLKSVNGPSVTIIEGAPGSNGSNDTDSVRGVYMGSGSRLDGFTVTNGYTATATYSMDIMGGGIWAETNCVATNCLISGCFASGGGGGIQMYGSTLDNCTLLGNWTGSSGGGAGGGTLNNCIIKNNFAGGYGGGGVASCTLNRCIVVGNISLGFGGGAFDTILNNCLITENTSTVHGGGVYGGTINNCTVTSNTANHTGGGTISCHVYNSVVWGNTAVVSANDFHPGMASASGHNSCASDGLTDGVNGCIIANPKFVDAANGNYQLLGNSTCINAGTNSVAPMPIDLAGNGRISGGTVDMGAYEYGYITYSILLASEKRSYDSAMVAGDMIAVTANVPWTVTESLLWITITSGNTGHNNGTFTYSLSANSSDTPRSGTVTIAGGGITKDFTIHQGGASTGWDTSYMYLGGGWRRLSWLGDYAPLTNSWIYHKQHDYMYIFPSSTSGNIFFYTTDMGWFWTKSAMYPYMYRFSDGAWLWYLKGSDNPRQFFNMATQQWENH